MRRALEEGAVNVGQGFPDYPIDPRLAEFVQRAILEGHNQYAPMQGVAALREGIAKKLKASYGHDFNPDTEITITCGGTEAIFDAIQAVIGAGDEAIVFDPAYDSYDPAVRLAGGRCVHIPLKPPGFSYDWDEVKRAITPRTRLIVINSPHNPSCTLASSEDLQALSDLTRGKPITILSDEVYEHIVFDGRKHASALAHPELRERSFTVFTFSIAAPLQHAIAHYVEKHPESWQALAAFFTAKRALLTGLLQGTAFRPISPAGTYFQLVDYGQLSQAIDIDFVDRLIREAKVATIPLSPFYATAPKMTLLRLCLAKSDETLREAAARLSAFAERIAKHG